VTLIEPAAPAVSAASAQPARMPTAEGERGEEGLNRAEVRGLEVLESIGVPVMTRAQFAKRYKAIGGGSEEAVRSFSDKVMDGIFPLLANTWNVIEKLIPAVSRREWVQTVHVEAAKRVLGLVSDSGYAFVLGSDLALAQEKGMLALAKTIFQGSSFAILEKDPTKVADIEKFIAAEGLQERVFVFTKASLAAAKLSKAGVSLKAMISSDELMLAEELEEALNDQPIVMNESMRKRFLNAAGQLFQSLADNIAGQFALLRSA